MERRGKKLLMLGVVAATSDVEGGLAAAAALLEIGNAQPSDSDGTGVRGERDAWALASGVRERGKEVTVNLRIRGKINGPNSKTIWVESQLRFKVRHCRTAGAALPHSPKQWELAIIYMTLSV